MILENQMDVTWVRARALAPHGFPNEIPEAPELEAKTHSRRKVSEGQKTDATNGLLFVYTDRKSLEKPSMA